MSLASSWHKLGSGLAPALALALALTLALADEPRPSLGLGLYKCWAMGVLPTGSGDWLQFETRLQVGR